MPNLSRIAVKSWERNPLWLSMRIVLLIPNVQKNSIKQSATVSAFKFFTGIACTNLVAEHINTIRYLFPDFVRESIPPEKVKGHVFKGVFMQYLHRL